MKTVSIDRASGSLAKYASELNDEIVVVTKRNRPVAALVPLKTTDRESMALSTHPEFLELIRRARGEIATRKTTSLPEMRAKVLTRRGPRKRVRVTAAKRGRE